MSKKEILKQYFHEYGEIEVINDLASILQDLGQEWLLAGNKKIGYTFSDAAITIANVANKLEIIENNFLEEQGLSSSKEDQIHLMKKEFDELTKYFNTLSLKELSNLFRKNRKALYSKLKRLKYLKKYLKNK